MNPKVREFENDHFLKDRIQYLIAKHTIKSVIETGTEYGGSATAFAQWVPVVVTMDIQRKCEELPANVHFMLGDSAKLLADAIAYIDEPKFNPILFFLDAHSSIETDSCPLRDELRAIADRKGPPPVVVIHDFQVPGKDFGFDTYRDGPLCWEYIEDLIPEIFPGGFVRTFNEEAAGSRRGCVFIEPLPTYKEEA